MIMGDKLMKVANTCYIVSVKEIVSIITLVLVLVGAYNAVLASVDATYSRKENVIVLGEKIDKVETKLDSLLNHFSIKGIEGNKYGK